MWKKIVNKLDSTDSLVSLALGLAVVLVVGMTIINYVKTKTQVATSTTKQEKSATNPTNTSLPAKHTVKAGETLWSISETYFKSGYNWVDIAKANTLVNADYVEVGQTLTIPNVAPVVTPTGAVSSASTSGSVQKKSYTVVSGDDLWDIARTNYGDGYKWVDIAKANNLANPSLIFAGNVLMLP